MSGWLAIVVVVATVEDRGGTRDRELACCRLVAVLPAKYSYSDARAVLPLPLPYMLDAGRHGLVGGLELRVSHT